MSIQSKAKRFTKQQRLDVWNKYHGKCAYCGCELPYNEMQIDHHIPLYQAEFENVKGLHTMENYYPSCRACNFYKGTNTIDLFRNQLQTLVERLNKIFIFRLAVKYGLITINKVNVTFEFEKVI